MKNYVMTLAYDGSDYLGWQKTSAGPSIEETLQNTLERILQEPITLQAASRTDRGVHAEGQFVNFFSSKGMTTESLKAGLNALLPPNIRVIMLKEMPEAFHPTLHALGKEYHYQISLGPWQLPHERFFSWHVPYELQIASMQGASRYFIGEHDFSSFCNQRKNLNYTDKTRRVDSIEIQQSRPDKLLIIIKGNHFLYKMVRNLVGTLVYVGRGKIQPEAIVSILSGKSRPLAAVTAPAHGLTLKKIYYPSDLLC